MRVSCSWNEELPQASVAVTRTTAAQSPTVVTDHSTGPEHVSDAEVAASAAASASATDAWQAAIAVAETTGAVVSAIVNVATHELWLPHASVAVKVRVSTEVPPQPGDTEADDESVTAPHASLAANAPSHASRAAALPAPSHGATTSPGH